MPITETPKRIAGQWATMAGTMIFKVPVGETWILSRIGIANTDGVQRIPALYQVPDGEIVEPVFMLFPDAQVDAHSVVDGYRGAVFEEGDELWALADEDDKVSVSVSYSERTGSP